MSPAGHPSDDQLDAATWCGHLIPAGSVHAFLAEHRHELFPSELFADVVRQGGGHPSVPAEVVATVMVLQALEGLSDREAISALRRDIAWKVACGLRLDDEGFHPTVLVYWRNRIRASSRPRRTFEAVRQVVEQTGVLTGRGRRVLDSTILEDAVATQDTVTQLVAAIRRVRRLVAVAREVELAAHDYDRPGKPVCAWDDLEAKQALVSGLVNDALALLAVVADLELEAEQAEAVALLALVAGQDVEPGQRPGSWRIARKVAADRVISVVDPQARHTRKTSAQRRDGYKAHIAAEPVSGLVTECALTAASVADGPTGVGLLAGEQPGLEVLGDSGYGSGQTRAALRVAGHTQTIKPIPLHSAVPGGFTIHDFRIDTQAGMVRCPAGVTAPITSSGRVSFARHCRGCLLRRRCTTAKRGRTIHLHPHEDELRAARRRATSRSFQASYRRWRPMVERSIAWLVADGCRRVPYRGIQRNEAWWSLRVAAVNLRRLLMLGLARHDGAWMLA
ncbi:MAG TPA: IS1182 family transposase [Candidatus Limnocylindria bacterium]|nr:IS1182 family transposase [Candidatus Limnocylindria bacterium]